MLPAEARLDAYRETGETVAREFPLRLALLAAVALVAFLLGFRASSIIWWALTASLLGAEMLAYRAFFAARPISVSNAKAAQFGAISFLCSAIYVWPAAAFIQHGAPASQFAAASFLAGSLIHILVHNSANRLIFASAATPMAVAFAWAGAHLSYAGDNIIPILTVVVFLYGVVLAFVARDRNAARMKEAMDLAVREREAALKASAAKSMFLAKMSHELRTPLNGVLGMADALKPAVTGVDDQARLGALVGCAEALMRMLNDAIEHSNIETRRVVVSPAPQSLESLVREAAALYRAAAAEKGLSLVLDFSAVNTDRVLADAGKLRHALVHLVDNAVRFTERGTVLIKAATEGDAATIVVSDTGRGMSAGELARIFEPFEQADNSMTRAHDGAGLGLAVARGLAHAMGGDVTAASEPGRGSTLTLTVMAPPAPLPAPVAAPARAGTRILLVEDNLVNREVVKGFLRPLKANVTEAENGAEALERLNESAFDLIFMDLHMPVMDGLSAISAIRAANAPFAGTPIVVLTAAASEEDRAASFAAGADGFLAKPVRRDAVAGAVQKFVHGDAVRAAG